MYHYNPETALEELTEEAVLPHPVNLRDMIVRSRLKPDRALALNRSFQDYLQAFGELQKIVKPMLEELAKTERK
jgi:predicted NACHT family NTPase